jgi:hypothetical protein
MILDNLVVLIVVLLLVFQRSSDQIRGGLDQ